MKIKVNKSEFFFALIIVALCYISFGLSPNMSNINFLAHCLSIFSISLALIAFISPILQRYRNNLILSESKIIGNNKESIKQLSDSISDMDKRIEEIDLELQDNNCSDDHKDLLEEKKSILQIKTEFEKFKSDLEDYTSPFFLSGIITKYFNKFKIWMKICLIMIIIMIVVNHILFTSPVFSSFIHRIFPYISNLSELKIYISNLINLLTLAAHLYFLYTICMSTMTTLMHLNKK